MALHRQALGKDKEALVASSPHPGGTSELQLVFCAVRAAGQCPHVVLGRLQGSRGTGCRELGTGSSVGLSFCRRYLQLVLTDMSYLQLEVGSSLSAFLHPGEMVLHCKQAQ